MPTQDEIYTLRDKKVKPHLSQYAPVWIVDETFIPNDQSIQFHAVFQHNIYGWVKRRYLYDGFNDVLYHKGQLDMDEDAALEVVEAQDAYIDPTVADIPNSYGG